MNKITKADRMFKNASGIKKIDVSALKNIETATNIFEGAGAPNIKWGSMKPVDATGAFLNYYGGYYGYSGPFLDVNVDDYQTAGYIGENETKMNIDETGNFNGYATSGFELPKSIKYTELRTFYKAVESRSYIYDWEENVDVEIDLTGAPESYLKGTADAPSQFSIDMEGNTNSSVANFNITLTIPDNITNLDYAFYKIGSLASLNIKGGKNVTSAQNMLSGRSEGVLVKGCNEFTSLVNAKNMFNRCFFADGIHSGFEKVVNASGMFNGCDVKNVDFNLFKSAEDLSSMFSNVNELDIVITEDTFPKAKNVANMFYRCSIGNITINGLNNISDASDMFAYLENGNIIINGLNSVTKATNMFNNVGESRSNIILTINGLNGLADASNMFGYSPYGISSLTINGLKNVTNTTNMFNMSIGEKIDLSSMKKITNATNMFKNGWMSEVKFDGFSNLTEFQGMLTGAHPNGLHIITNPEGQNFVTTNKTALGLDGKIFFFEDGWENFELDYATMEQVVPTLDKSKRYCFTFTGLENAPAEDFVGEKLTGYNFGYKKSNFTKKLEGIYGNGLIFKMIISIPDTITNLEGCFSNSGALEINIIKASGVTNINGLLCKATRIKEFNCDAFSNVTSASNFIYRTDKLEKVDVSGLTSLKNAGSLFTNDYQYNDIPVNIIGLDKISKNFTAVDDLFNGRSVANIKTINFDTDFPNVETANSLLYSSEGVEEIIAASSNSKLKQVIYMLSECHSIKKLTLKSSLITDIKRLAYKSSLEVAEVDLPNVTTAILAFSECKIKDIDISSMTKLETASDMFNATTTLKTAKCGSMRPISVDQMFKRTGIEEFDCSIFEMAEDAKSLFNNCENLKVVSNAVFKNCWNVAKMFQKSGIERFIGKIDFSSASNASSMFHLCPNIRKFDVSSFTSIEYMGDMFKDAKNIKSITWNWDTIPDTSPYLSNMFFGTYVPEKGKIIIDTNSKAVSDLIKTNYSDYFLTDSTGNPNYEIVFN